MAKRNGKIVTLSISEVEEELLDWVVPLMPPGHQTRSGVLQASLLRLAWEKHGRGHSLPPKFAELVGETPKAKKK